VIAGLRPRLPSGPFLAVKAGNVAYTFRKEPLAEAQQTPMRLWQWALAQ
jgi:hypothetical protein